MKKEENIKLIKYLTLHLRTAHISVETEVVGNLRSVGWFGKFPWNSPQGDIFLIVHRNRNLWHNNHPLFMASLLEANIFKNETKSKIKTKMSEKQPEIVVLWISLKIYRYHLISTESWIINRTKYYSYYHPINLKKDFSQHIPRHNIQHLYIWRIPRIRHNLIPRPL